MSIKTIDAVMVQKCFLSGAKRIEANKEYINELNVFPVPDGDTGTNMTLTIMSAAKDVSTLENPSMEQVCKAISSGSLRGARGNSGVILSQLFRGFAKELRDYDGASVTVLAAAFERAVETAYKAVMKPKEGTILTVARGGAERARQLAEEGEEDILVFAEAVVAHMKEVLAITPELLPVLKEAGVVDSGGQGLLTVMEGILDALNGKEVDFSSVATASAVSTGSTATGAANDTISTADIKFGYCTEFIIMLEKQYDMDEEIKFKAYLESIGDSIVVVSDDDIVKVHVHTNDPGLAIQKALTYGSLTKMKIDNMREEHNERVIQGANRPAEEKQMPAGPRKPFGFVAVSIGEGLNDIFKGIGADYIIEGGQTMNPSTEDMLNAIAQVNADTVFILPNNSNIILAAEQAKSLTADKEIVVIPSKTVPQGITALINFMPDKSAEDNRVRMTDEMQNVKTGQVTYAVRDTSMDGKEIKAGDIMGIGDKTILSVGADISEVTFALLEELMDEDSELVSLYYGQETTEEDANALADRVMEAYPDVDVEVHPGGQPIYYYVLSVE
ncbi:MAG: DAK2 domain-containing protein [Lachnospiraceae bacterium]|nr:DAK2 domain-containing protein [Lachnospiraceae bacterium]